MVVEAWAERTTRQVEKLEGALESFVLARATDLDRVEKIEKSLGGWPQLLKEEEASARAQEEALGKRIETLATIMSAWEHMMSIVQRRLERLGGPPSFEIRWMEEEKAILLAAIEYIELWKPGDDVPPIGQESVFDRLQSAVLAYLALVSKHDPPEEKSDAG